jgi:signal transduction histidine kinase
LIDDALRMSAGSLARQEVTVVKDIADLPLLPLDRHRMLLILVNLIRNAKQAMNGVIDRSPCITFSALLADGPALRITVTDNGNGIAPEHLARLFSHGFTTRKDGHGFGLHSCALAAQEMGGSLTVHSDGAGQGATFILDVPLDGPQTQ